MVGARELLCLRAKRRYPNGDADTVGDEGESFRLALSAECLTQAAQFARTAVSDDKCTITVDGETLAVEFMDGDENDELRSSVFTFIGIHGTNSDNNVRSSKAWIMMRS